MSTIIIALAALALFHYIYEVMFAPYFRMRIRNRLFTHRDQLRMLKINDQIDARSFRQLQASINLALAIQHKFTFIDLYLHHKKWKEDKQYQKKLTKRAEYLASHINDTSKPVYEGLIQCLLAAMVVNSAGWVPYLLPVLYGLTLKHRFERWLERLIVTNLKPERITTTTHGIRGTELFNAS